MTCYSIDGLTPVIDPTAYVHPSAVLIGDVIIGPHCYVGPLAALRGDFGRIVLEEGANLQDTCVMHGFPASDTVVERNGHVGHGAVLHGCVVGEDALIGMNAVILDDARIAPRCIVSAGALVKAGFQCEAQSLVLGSPAKVTRRLSDDEVSWKQTGTRAYQQLTRRCLETMHECQPLTGIEAGRGRYRDDAVRPKLPGGA